MSQPMFRTVTKTDKEYPWAITIKSSATVNGAKVAEASGHLIDRFRIKKVFYVEMEGADEGLSSLAFDLFTRWGHLKPHFMEHCAKKGLGVWGKEINESPCIIHLGSVSVDSSWRRRGVRRRLVANILNKANGKKWFAFVLPTVQDNGDFLASRGTPVAFVRSLGFRRVGDSEWFCLASDPDHPSRRLAAADDYNPQMPCAGEGANTYALALVKSKSKDEDCVASLEKLLKLVSITDPSWRKVDCCHNSILHHAAVLYKPKTVSWILNSPIGLELALLRNSQGYTPTELVESRMEDQRVKDRAFATMSVCNSDYFRGHPDSAVQTLLELKGIQNPTAEETLRAKGGCSCGMCIGGVLSPRMWRLLKTEAYVISNTAAQYKRMCWSYKGQFSRTVLNEVEEGGAMYKGFCNIFKYIEHCLSRKQLPTDENVRKFISEAEENPPVTMSFLNRGASVSDAFSVVIEQAILADEDGPDLDDDDGFGLDDDGEVKECRNDNEWCYVSGSLFGTMTHMVGYD